MPHPQGSRELLRLRRRHEPRPRGYGNDISSGVVTLTFSLRRCRAGWAARHILPGNSCGPGVDGEGLRASSMGLSAKQAAESFRPARPDLPHAGGVAAQVASEEYVEALGRVVFYWAYPGVDTFGRTSMWQQMEGQRGTMLADPSGCTEEPHRRPQRLHGAVAAMGRDAQQRHDLRGRVRRSHRRGRGGADANRFAAGPLLDDPDRRRAHQRLSPARIRAGDAGRQVPARRPDLAR